MIERDKKIKKILSAEYGHKAVKVMVVTGVFCRGGEGFFDSRTDITILADDPCLFRQAGLPCDSYCINRVCAGNNQRLEGVWGNSVRQLQDREIRDNVERLIEPEDCWKLDIRFV